MERTSTFKYMNENHFHSREVFSFKLTFMPSNTTYRLAFTVITAEARGIYEMVWLPLLYTGSICEVPYVSPCLPLPSSSFSLKNLSSLPFFSSYFSFFFFPFSKTSLFVCFSSTSLFVKVSLSINFLPAAPSPTFFPLSQTSLFSSLYSCLHSLSSQASHPTSLYVSHTPPIHLLFSYLSFLFFSPKPSFLTPFLLPIFLFSFPCLQASPPLQFLPSLPPSLLLA